MKAKTPKLLVALVLVGCSGNGINPGSFTARESACSSSWAQTLGDSMGDDVVGLAYAPDGALFVLGRYSGSLALRSTQLPAAVAPQMFLVKLAPNGDVDWSKSFGPAVDGTSLVADAQGAVMLAGTAPPGSDFSASSPPGNASRAFVMKLDGAGLHQWTQWFFEPQPMGSVRPSVSQLSLDLSGEVAVLGTSGFSMRVDEQTHSGAAVNLWVTKLDPATGRSRWLRHFPTELKAPSLLSGLLAVDGDGIAISGLYDGKLKLGEVALPNGTRDVFWARFDTRDGSHLASTAFPVDGFAQPTALRSKADGSATMVGSFHGVLGPLTSDGPERDIFWFGLSSSGERVYTRRFGSPGADEAFSVALVDDEAWMTGWVSDGAELGAHLLGRPGQATGFLARLSTSAVPNEVIAFTGSADGVGKTLVLGSGCVATAGTFQGGELSLGPVRVGIFDSRSESRSFVVQLKTSR